VILKSEYDYNPFLRKEEHRKMMMGRTTRQVVFVIGLLKKGPVL
jgi:hypothetical protein